MASPTAGLAIAAWRNDDVFEFPLRVVGFDPSDLALAMQIRLAPDTPGAPLVDLVKVINANAQGLRVTDVGTTGGAPSAIIRIRINKTTLQALPYAGEIGSPTVLSYALLIAGRTRLVGEFQVLASTYGSDNAPLNRQSTYGAHAASAPSSGATLTILPDGGATVALDGADLLGPALASATAAAAQAVAAAEQAVAALPYINGELADFRSLIAQVAASVPIVGAFRSQRVGINNVGQSLGEGSNGALTTAQQFNSIGFPWRALNPGAFVPLTVSATQADNPNGTLRGESPMYGAARHIKELVAARVIPTAASQDYQLVATNNAVGGQAIDYFMKGGANYAAVMSQINAAKNLSQADGKTYKFAASFWTQGEAGEATIAIGRDKLIQLAADYNAGAKAITGQVENCLLFTYQTPTQLLSPLAQYKASLASPLIVLATPIYHLDFYDALHIDAASSQILGAYYGYVYWWQEITRRAWKPVRPIRITRVSGRVYDVEYHVPVGRLVIDTDSVPATTNNGFYLFQSESVLQALPATAALKAGTTNVVRVTAADDIPVGAAHSYGLQSINGKPNFAGYGGNLRDQQGDSLKFDVRDGAGNMVRAAFPMHNWGAVTVDTIPTSGSVTI